jgi:hypothetical protein
VRRFDDVEGPTFCVCEGERTYALSDPDRFFYAAECSRCGRAFVDELDPRPAA